MNSPQRLTNDCIRDVVAEIRWWRKQPEYAFRVIEANHHRDRLRKVLRAKYANGGIVPMDQYGCPFCLK